MTDEFEDRDGSPPPKRTADSEMALRDIVRPTRKGLTPIKLVGYTVSTLVTISLLGWTFARSMSALGSGAAVEANQTSHQSGGAGKRDKIIRELSEKARRIDAELMRDRSYRLQRRNTATKRKTQQVHDEFNRRIEKLEEQVRGKHDVPPGTVEYDMMKRLEDMRADPSISDYQQRQLRD